MINSNVIPSRSGNVVYISFAMSGQKPRQAAKAKPAISAKRSANGATIIPLAYGRHVASLSAGKPH